MRRYATYSDRTHAVDWDIEIPSSGMCIDVRVEFEFIPGNPGNVFGRPEDCWPAEAHTLNIMSVVGKESRVCCMDLLERERVPLAFAIPGYPGRMEPLLERLRDQMLTYVVDRAH